MFHGKIKASEKLPRGTYLYIRVGDRFYAGEQVLLQTDTTTKTYDYNQWNWWGSRNKYSTSMAKYLREKKGQKVPPYLVESDEFKGKVQQAVTGRQPLLTDEFKDVKQFRKLNQAKAACERLESLYGGLGIRIAIEMHEGDK
jgi:hypothetical protein